MVQATCKHCGQIHSFDDADVPPSGKVVKCQGCAKPVTVMPGGEAGDALLGMAVPKRATALSEVEAEAGVSAARPSPLAGALDVTPAKAPESPLTLPDLPAPAASGKKGSLLPDLPAPANPASTIALGNAPILPPAPSKKILPDLPTPKGADSLVSSELSDLPAPKASPGLSDLPAPKASPGLSDLPAPKASPGLSDLPAPKAPPGLADLPAPKSAPMVDDLPAPKASPGFSDLPAPKGGLELPDLPAPKGGLELPDLPAPKGGLELPDLPAPKGASAGELPDLLAPQRPVESAPALDLDQLDLAPSSDPAPAASLLDLGGDGLDLPGPGELDLGAPLGPPGGGLDLGAPLGESGLDLGEPIADGGAAPLDLGEPLAGGLDLGSSGGDPLGGGLDLGSSGGDPLGGSGLELDSPPSAPEPLSLGGDDDGGAEPLSLGDSDSGGGDGLNLDNMDLAAPSTSGAGGSSYGEVELPSAGDDMELGKPSGDGVVSFAKPSATAKPPPSKSLGLGKPKQSNDALELDLNPDVGPAPTAKPMAPERAKAKPTEAPAEQTSKPRSKKKLALLGAAAVLVLGLGAGGFMFFRSWQEDKAADEAKEKAVKTAAAELISDKPGHWQRAAKAAEDVLSKTPDNEKALAVAAQALYAAAFENGKGAGLAKAKEYARKLAGSSAEGPGPAKTDALRLLAEKEAKKAAKKLSGLAKKNKKDKNLFLFLGWAELAAHNYPAAGKAFQSAATLGGKRAAAHYGKGLAELGMGKADKAKKSFEQALNRNKSHFGSLVGLAELADSKSASEREKRFLEVLGRDDVDKADPRAVSRAWSLAGEVAFGLGRHGEARDRFAKAKKLDEANLDAYVGEARVELAGERRDNAAALLDQVLKLSPKHLAAQLTKAEMLLVEDRKAARAVIDKVLGKGNTLSNSADISRAHMVRGRIGATDPETYGEAESDFKTAIENAAPGNVEPHIALAYLYNKMGRGEEAVQLLGPVEEAAKTDPALAVTLGIAYLGGKNPAKAKLWFEGALAQRPDDVEAKFQLGEALFALDKGQEALAAVSEAYQASGKREDIGLRLAVLYEELDKDPEAYKLYDELVVGSNVSTNVRETAGRFYARMGDVKRAAKLGDAILKDNPKSPSGLYLKGEALFAVGKFAEAFELFDNAVSTDPQPQFLEGRGRALEGLKRLEPALKSYKEAIEKEPRMLAPRLARLRILLITRRFKAVLEEVEEHLRLFPDEPRIFYYRGASYVELRRHKKAIKELVKVTTALPRMAEAHFSLGIAYNRIGKAEKSSSSLAKATRLARGEESWLVEAYRVLGYSHREAGHRGAARDAWRNYLDRAERGSEEYREVRRLLQRLEAR